MKLLLHICCAPCSVACIESLRAEGIDVYGLWYNPNIHPFSEYKARKNTLRAYAESISLKLFCEGDYGLRQFICETPSIEFGRRCEYCYNIRTDFAAQFAAENGFDAFSTTLLISPYQNHELLKRSAEKSAEKFKTEFLYRDFRPLFRDGQQKARDLGLYMQKYCGCIFSEEERYRKRNKILRDNEKYGFAER